MKRLRRRVLRVDACAHFGRWPGIRKPVSSYAAATFVPLDTHLPSSSPGTDYTHGTVVDRDDDAVFRCPIRRDALTTIRAEPFLLGCAQDTNAGTRSDISASPRLRLPSWRRTWYCQNPETKAASVHEKKGRQGLVCKGRAVGLRLNPPRLVRHGLAYSLGDWLIGLRNRFRTSAEAFEMG